MNIAITSGFKQNDTIWKNGIAQNVLMLYDVLNAIDIVDRVTLLNVKTELDQSKESYLDGYDFMVMNEHNLDYIRDTYDVLITLGAIPPHNWMDIFKQKDSNKIVFYKGGNTFVNQIEMIMYGQFKGWPAVDLSSKNAIENYTNVDEVWMVPQQEFHNKDFYEIAYKTKSRVVPFVWSSKFIEDSAETFRMTGIEPMFDYKQFEKWTLVSFEPNMSVLKNMMPIINYTEHAYRIMSDSQKNNFDSLIITNASGHKTNKELIHSITHFDLFKDKKVFFDGRYPIVYVLAKFSHMVVSHQWGNALNYAYLDACYFGIPLVHNAHLCSDLGYYFEDWKLKDASNLILKVMDERRSDVTYTERQRSILKRYTTQNQGMLDSYKELLLGLWEHKSKDTTYDCKNNITL